MPPQLAQAVWLSNGHYLVVKRQFAEGRDVFSPLYQNKQLLLHRLAHIPDGGWFLLGDIRRVCRTGDADLHADGVKLGRPPEPFIITQAVALQSKPA